MEMMKSRMHSRRWRRSWRWEGRRRGSDVIEEFLVWRPAPAREHSSEGFEPRKVIEVKEEDGYEENVEEDFDDEDDEDNENDEDDEENAIEGEIKTN